MRDISRRELLKSAAAVSAVGSATLMQPAAAQDVVKVGILHSLTGTIAIAEASIVDAEKLAIDEINASGGVMGKKIEPIVEDGASDWPTFAEKARSCWQRTRWRRSSAATPRLRARRCCRCSSSCNGLLYYPTYYEGQEIANIMYTAQEATQSVIAAIEWLAKNKGKSFYLIGSDYIWPRTCNKIAKPTIARVGGKVARRGILSARPHRVLFRSSTRSRRPSPTASIQHAWWAAATSPSTSS